MVKMYSRCSITSPYAKECRAGYSGITAGGGRWQSPSPPRDFHPSGKNQEKWLPPFPKNVPLMPLARDPQICQKVHFLPPSLWMRFLSEGLGPKGPLFRGSTPPSKTLGYGPDSIVLLHWQDRGVSSDSAHIKSGSLKQERGCRPIWSRPWGFSVQKTLQGCA